MTFHISPGSLKAITGLKFSNCLPHDLAVHVLESRLRNPDAVEYVLRQPKRIVVDYLGKCGVAEFSQTSEVRRHRMKRGRKRGPGPQIRPSSMGPQERGQNPYVSKRFLLPRGHVLTPEDFLLNRPSRAARLPRPVLMPLYRHPHRGKHPPIILRAPHPTPLQLEDVFD